MFKTVEIALTELAHQSLPGIPGVSQKLPKTMRREILLALERMGTDVILSTSSDLNLEQLTGAFSVNETKVDEVIGKIRTLSNDLLEAKVIEEVA